MEGLDSAPALKKSRNVRLTSQAKRELPRYVWAEEEVEPERRSRKDVSENGERRRRLGSLWNVTDKKKT